MVDTAHKKTQASAGPLADDELELLDAYWRAANYLSVGQIYLLANPLLREPLRRAHQAAPARPLGDDARAQLRLRAYEPAIRARDLDIDLRRRPGARRPGHGRERLPRGHLFRGLLARVAGRGAASTLFRQFSFPGGIPSHVAPETPGSIHEGGELGYSLAHAFGAAFDNPDLVACLRGRRRRGGDRPAGHELALEQVPQPAHRRRRAADPAPERLQDRQSDRARAHPRGGARRAVRAATATSRSSSPAGSTATRPSRAPALRGRARRGARRDPRRFSAQRASREAAQRPRWPMIVLRTPKGWTGPREVDGLPVEGTWRSHQVPLAEVRDERRAPPAARGVDARATRRRSSSTTTGALVAGARALCPRRASGGWARTPTRTAARCCATSSCPTSATTRSRWRSRGRRRARRRACWARFLRDVVQRELRRTSASSGPTRLRRTGSQTSSRRPTVPGTQRSSRRDDHLAPDGRVDGSPVRASVPGMARGLSPDRPPRSFQLLRGVHPHRRLDVQPAREVAEGDARRFRGGGPIASLNYLLTSHVWRQDHNGFSHQDPGFIDHVVNKKAEIIRVYLPPDANTLLSVMDHCLRSRDYVNVDRRRQAARAELPRHGRRGRACTRGHRDLGVGIERRGRRARTSSWRAAATCPRSRRSQRSTFCAQHVPDLRIRVVNVVDLMRLQPDTRASARPLGRASSTRSSRTDKPVVFAYHGYPWLIHRLTYRRTNHRNIHVRGYKEEGTTTTPFDMVMLNDLDRFHLVMDAIDRLPDLPGGGRHPAGDGRRPAARPRVDARARRGSARRSATGHGLTDRWARSSSSTPARRA